MKITKPRRGRFSCRPAFSLVELLVVIAIISLLAGLLLPTLGQAKNSARSIACIGNLHQIGIALTAYLPDNGDRLPVCAGYLPSQQPTNPPITTTLFPGQDTNKLFCCPADNTIFDNELTSYAWDFWLNGAPYITPQWAPVYTNEAIVIVDGLFGGRGETPLMGDANPFHGLSGTSSGKNALYFDGRVLKARTLE